MTTLVSYKEVRNHAVSQIASVFTTRTDILVAAHPGRFDEAEIRRLVQRTPALLTSLIGIRQDSPDDNMSFELVTWLIHRASAVDKLYDDCLNILSVLLPVLRGIDAEWSHGGAERVEAKNLYAGSLDALNVTLWAVSWSWPLRGSVVIVPGAPPEGPGLPGEIDDLLNGGILTSADLEPFAGYDAKTLVGDREADDQVDLP